MFNPSASAWSRSASGSSINSGGDMRTSCPTTPRASTPTIVKISGEVWEAIILKLDKLDKLDKIDRIVTSLKNISKCFETAKNRLDVIESRLSEAESANSSLRADYDAFFEKSTQHINDIKLRQEKFQENRTPQNSGDASGSVTDP